ncbi:sensor histidine kinase [Paenibacillus sp. GYB006]|uniref:cache domain-containing sensor histidine kinase n=1 Tax=Paenibacillus sp. GYB006 TaxID=2994394 RepID=UPI002F964910
MNLRMKLYMAFLSLIVIPMCAMGIGTFLVTSHTIEKKYSEQAEYSLKSISYSIENVFREMNNVTDSGVASSVFHMALIADNPVNLGEGDQLSLNASQRNFRSLLYNYPAISYAFLYNLQPAPSNRIVSIFTKENFNALPFDKFKRHSLYNEVMELNGVPRWIAPFEYPEFTGSEPVFTQIRLIKELSFFQNIGILVVQIKNWEIDRIFRNLSISGAQDTHFMMVNEDGLIVYDPSSTYQGQYMSELVEQEKPFSKGYESLKVGFNGRESIVSSYQMKDSPWHLISVTSWKSLSQETTVLAKWYVIIIMACLLAALMFNILFMNRITGTIAVLVRFMRRVERGDFSARVEGKGYDEMQLLAQGFNDLMDKISSLFSRVKAEQMQKTSAELRVLQAQIKPHFLFNTLESINGLALRGEGRKVSEMVTRLGSILRISIQDKEEITIQEEVKHLKSYLEIQKYRFPDLFEYEMDIPSGLESFPMLKLTLQPLVENSIQHGFEGIDYKGKIKVSAWEDMGKVILQVEDNGLGMDNEVLSRFEYMLKESSNWPDHKAILKSPVMSERRGLGVRSVADRIRIQYGDHYGIFICSSKGHGTVIRCILPKNDWGDRP